MCGCFEWIYNELISRLTLCQSSRCQKYLKFRPTQILDRQQKKVTFLNSQIAIVIELWQTIRPFWFHGYIIWTQKIQSGRRDYKNYLVKVILNKILPIVCVIIIACRIYKSKRNKKFDKKLFKLCVASIRQNWKNLPKIQYSSF